MKKNPIYVIESMYDTLHRVEKLIADFVLNNKEFVIEHKLKHISEKIGVSESSIIRFSQLLGFSGFSDFRVSLAQFSGSLEEDSVEVTNVHTSEGITKTTLLNNIEALKKTIEFIDYAEVKKAAISFLEANKIIIAGSGYSGLIGQMFYYRMKTTGFHLTYATDFHAMKQAEYLLEEDSLVLGISQSGKTKELLNLFQHSKEKKVRTIALTTSSNNKLAQLADIHLLTALSNHDYIGNYYASEVVFKSVLDSLYIQINLLLTRKHEIDDPEILKDIYLSEKAYEEKVKNRTQ